MTPHKSTRYAELKKGAGDALLVLATVAGYDSAAYGLPKKQAPLLVNLTQDGQRSATQSKT